MPHFSAGGNFPATALVEDFPPKAWTVLSHQRNKNNKHCSKKRALQLSITHLSSSIKLLSFPSNLFHFQSNCFERSHLGPVVAAVAAAVTVAVAAAVVVVVAAAVAVAVVVVGCCCCCCLESSGLKV